MKRSIYKRLKEWQLSSDRKPLILYGARQVGKTYILQEFGRREFEHFVYVNCYKNTLVSQIFQGDPDVKRLIVALSAYAKQHIVEGKTLLFLDEVQEIPAVVSSLKYFCEEMPGLHVVVAGSLLGVMTMRGESFPVGKVNIMHLYPMTFDEFLAASGEERLLSILESQDYALLSAFHDKLTDLLRQYYYVGGMPEAVRHFSEHRDLQRVRRIQKEILAAYEADIAKHTASQTQRVRMVWQSIPSQLAKENKKFIYGLVRKGARAKEYEVAIQWLLDAGLVYKVERTRDAAVPLKFYADPNAFKLYLLDVGLLGAMSDTPADQMLIGNNVFVEFKGAFAENYVLQQLKARAGLPVYYYSKEGSTMEVDFVLQHGSRVIPVEVKAEENVKAKSLQNFVCHDFASYHLSALRFSMKGYVDQGWMQNVPLYAVSTFSLE